MQALIDVIIVLYDIDYHKNAHQCREFETIIFKAIPTKFLIKIFI